MPKRNRVTFKADGKKVSFLAKKQSVKRVPKSKKRVSFTADGKKVSFLVRRK